MHGVLKISEPIHVGVGVKRDLRAHMCGRDCVRLCEVVSDTRIPNVGRLWVTHVPMFRRGWGEIAESMRGSRG